MTDLSIIKLKGKKRDYSKLFFERNPFPSTAIPERVPALSVDREEAIKHFQDTISSLSGNPTPFITVLIGEYGDGKTHLLNLFKHSVNSQLLRFAENEESTLAIYIRTPGRNFKDFFGEVLESIGRGTLETLSNKIIKDFIDKNKNEAKKFVIGNVKTIPKDHDVETFLQNSYVLEFFKKIRSNIFEHMEDSDIVYSFLFLSHPDYSALAWRWFLGGKLSASEREKLLITTNIDNKDQAYKQYKNLLKILQLVKISSIVLLIDELEKILFIGGLQKGQFYDDLRHLIDDSPPGTCYFFSIAPTQWNQLTKEPFALVRRLSENTLNLDRFEEKRTRELISAYVCHYRIKVKESEINRAFENCELDVAPFTEESITKIFQIREGNVFATLVLCRKLVDKCIDNVTKSNIITAEMVDEIGRAPDEIMDQTEKE